MVHDKDENGVIDNVRQENLMWWDWQVKGEKDECVLLTQHVGSM